MTARLKNLYSGMIEALEVRDLHIPTTAVKFFRKGDSIPLFVREHQPESITLTSCQAVKQASLGDVVCLTKDNIGCIAAAISFGLVDEYQDTPLGDNRVYTDLMRDQSQLGDTFIPPSPMDFTEGIVYACRDSNRMEFGLFGPEESGRFCDVRTAKSAIQEMTAIQPATTEAVFFYAPDIESPDLIPDVVVLSVRPVELARLVQAYQFRTGKRITGTMGAVRAVDSDLIVRPYLTQEINVSTFCVGARLIAQYEADRLGIGMPFHLFGEMIEGLKASQSGYPFHLYPGAGD
jgi:uncharacterized protein (DUF169 family)